MRKCEIIFARALRFDLRRIQALLGHRRLSTPANCVSISITSLTNPIYVRTMEKNTYYKSRRQGHIALIAGRKMDNQGTPRDGCKAFIAFPGFPGSYPANNPSPSLETSSRPFSGFPKPCLVALCCRKTLPRIDNPVRRRVLVSVHPVP
jgi:hypothetical protein